MLPEANVCLSIMMDLQAATEDAQTQLEMKQEMNHFPLGVQEMGLCMGHVEDSTELVKGAACFCPLFCPTPRAVGHAEKSYVA